MDIETRKKQIFVIFDELEAKIEILKTNIETARLYLADVHTQEEAEQYDTNYGDLEKGLKHIELF